MTDNYTLIDTNKKILYILFELNISSSQFYKEYKKSDFNIDRTVNYFLKNNDRLQKNFLSECTKKFEIAMTRMSGSGINSVNISEAFYPPLLKQIYNPPSLLFYKGNKIKTAKHYIAVVGTRKNSVYGRDVALYFSRELSGIGITIVSGMASGIDSYAHYGSLENDGGTVGVLGCGPDIIYPRENTKLFNAILSNGTIISEFFPGTPPLRSNFPARNRIISGLSMGTIVIEAPEKSGALITADFALNQNREVFAVPGNIFSNESAGCNELIRSGAIPACRTDDILCEISQFIKNDLPPAYFTDSNEKINKNDIYDYPNIKISDLKEEQKAVYSIIGFKPKSIEEISEETTYGIAKLLQIISELMLKKLIIEKKLNHFTRVC